MLRISNKDAQFILTTLSVTAELRMILSNPDGDDFVRISDDVADQLRDLCTDRLDTHGFDENYEPNEEGRRLESLIDKLYTG